MTTTKRLRRNFKQRLHSIGVCSLVVAMMTLLMLSPGCGSDEPSPTIYTESKNVEFVVDAAFVVDDPDVTGEYKWGVIRKPSTSSFVVFGDLRGMQTSVVASEVGEYVLRLEVTSGTIAARFDFVVSIENDSPELFLPTLRDTLVGEFMTVAGRVTDINDDAIVLLWKINRAPPTSSLQDATYDSRADDGFAVDSMGWYEIEVTAVDEDGATDTGSYEVYAGIPIADRESLHQQGGVILVSGSQTVHIVIGNSDRTIEFDRWIDSAALTLNGATALIYEGGRLHSIDTSSAQISQTITLTSNPFVDMAIIGTRDASTVLLEAPGSLLEVEMSTGDTTSFPMEMLREFIDDSPRLLAYNPELDVVYSLNPDTTPITIRTLSFGPDAMIEVSRTVSQQATETGTALHYSPERQELIELGSGEVLRVGATAQAPLLSAGFFNSSRGLQRLLRPQGDWSIALIGGNNSYTVISYSNTLFSSEPLWRFSLNVNDIALDESQEEFLLLTGGPGFKPGLYSFPLGLN